ncbi:rod shape-determining protein MreD [Phaeobacter sp. QD34_3]|uniref:rod shape-determining protein MreD n=1 Tax=unclassified Phaeobacter TaxID=2621772 RepID=UPI00237F407E|nr:MULTISPECIES: rod shape-determining protein MreD [unclassified Phaeobacter]MDE4134096.1 rod shape-determining protein MreD [Phaeobacter sp. QD34_3]MDE4137838.1 rod shape-determining protein MreD [Phaeobacter sp. QD34_24]
MASTSPGRIWLMRMAFPALALVLLFFHLLPLDTLPSRWAPPDLLLALALAWSLRRPDFVPVLLLGATMLMADMLFQRPPGLFALLVVLGCEFLKSRVLPHPETAFAAEWLAVAMVISGIVVLNRAILAILAVAQAPLGLTLIQAVLTIAVYPLVVLFSQQLLGVRKLSPAEAEVLGSR